MEEIAGQLQSQIQNSESTVERMLVQLNASEKRGNLSHKDDPKF
jgi:hypothetical protein